jgi:hypothetical protein
VSSIKTHSFPKWYEFTPDSRKICVMYADQVAVFDVLTGKKLCQVKRGNSGCFSIVKLIDNDTLMFEDKNRVLCMCSISEQKITALSSTCKEQYSNNKGLMWSVMKNHLKPNSQSLEQLVLIEKGNKIVIYDSPFSQNLGLEEFFHSHPMNIVAENKLYSTGCIGMVPGSLREFSAIYDEALKEGNE